MSKIKSIFGDEVQLGLFPGVSESGENGLPPRLKIAIQISIRDTYNDEKTTRVIPIELDSAHLVVPTIQAAIQHARTLQDIKSFCKGRNGEGKKEEAKRYEAEI